YDLDGKLLFARHMGEEFDKAEFGLKPVACETVAGYVFICLADQPADFAPMRAEVESYMAPHRIWEAKVAHESTIIEKGNWKLVWENNRECYHCSANHPELCVSFVDLDFGFDPETLSPEDREQAEEHFRLYEERTRAWETDGFPSSAVEQLTDCATNFRTQRLIMSGA
ncbi:aromatic ring-hydroxylating dioxygenase subunit alpha, partial [Pseudomonas aeruginosa]|nr:aromatic ring-hydroxylating dioxygenase subunit alpha [Pseudomonas aeruginosa]